MIDFINGPIDDVQAQPNKRQAVDNDCHGVQKYQRFVFWLCWIFTLCFIFASGRRNFIIDIISTNCESLHQGHTFAACPELNVESCKLRLAANRFRRAINQIDQHNGHKYKGDMNML